jgi:ABC-type dipeptide/oligopeptide/nickel transport system permease component
MIIPTLIGIATVVFIIVRLAPGNPAEILLGDYATPEAVAFLNQKMGLDRPVLYQYVVYLQQLLQGDFGRSFVTNLEVLPEIIRHLPYTLELALAAVVISILIGLPAGILSAVKKDTLFDRISMVVALFLAGIPLFWLGILLMLFFSIRLGWFPLIGAGDPASLNAVKYLVLPSIALAGTSIALIARITRSSVLEIVQQDFVRVARSKGLKEETVILKHVLKNAMIPVTTVIGLNIGQLLGGGVVIEMVFARPGLGKLLIDSIYGRDYLQVQGTVIVIAALFVLINLLVDLSYSLFDPRVRYQ